MNKVIRPFIFLVSLLMGGVIILTPMNVRAGSCQCTDGTSFSTPHVVGVVALILEDNSLTPNEVRAKLQSDALDLGTHGKDNIYGYGLVQANLEENNTELIDRVSLLESWKSAVMLTLADIADSINGLVVKTNNQETRITALESLSEKNNQTFPFYLNYLGSSDRKAIVCGYGEDYHLNNVLDLGYNCTFTYRQTSRGETASCRCKKT